VIIRIGPAWTGELPTPRRPRFKSQELNAVCGRGSPVYGLTVDAAGKRSLTFDPGHHAPARPASELADDDEASIAGSERRREDSSL